MGYKPVKDLKFSCLMQNEHGLVLYLFTLSLLGIAGAIALAVDLSREQLVARQVQSAANAAALAAAEQLSGDEAGWLNSKRAAVLALRSQSFHYVGKIFGSFALNSGTADPLEPDVGLFRRTGGSTGYGAAVIERGTYWKRDDGKFSFETLEGSPMLKVEEAAQKPGRFGVPVYMVGNAVQVTVQVSGVPSLFARMFGAPMLHQISRTAVAVFHDQLSAPVYAAAVPACRLLMDLNTHVAARYETKEFDASVQCVREVVATEADPVGPSAGQLFFGRKGYEIYNARPLVTVPAKNVCYPTAGAKVPNCKALPLYAVMGLPADEAGTTDAVSPEKLASYVAKPKSGTEVSLGERFAPLEKAIGANGFLTAYGSGVSEELRTQINSSGLTAAAAFTPKNFPWTAKESKILEWPPFEDFDQLEVPNPGVGAKDWLMTNPLCHDAAIGITPAVAKVLPVKLMVIAPKNEDYQYCDFEALFTHKDQDASAPTADTEPIVIGFVDAMLFDFSLNKYPADTLPPGMNGVAQRHRIAPEFFDSFNGSLSELGKAIAKATKKYQELFSEYNDAWEKCKDCQESAETPDDCKDVCGKVPPKPEVDPIDVPELGLIDLPADLYDCYILPDLASIAKVIAACKANPVTESCDAEGYCVAEASSDCALLSASAPMWGYAQANKACIPYKNPAADEPSCASKPDGCDLENPADLEELGKQWALEDQPFSFGCGGLRMRLTCDKDETFLSPVPGGQKMSRPSLVTDLT